ncbi:hypothetical protein M5D96_013753 [Drosophila gunungcola]|uniref:Uncharacterized protein n=1 Tax=Drosophila gunungcola TaxID=103775 RepID=A0A9P9YBG7_9MUSC|nr:hypothetical protein M5D96_013753 [Drosophila gunungcola]
MCLGLGLGLGLADVTAGTSDPAKGESFPRAVTTVLVLGVLLESPTRGNRVSMWSKIGIAGALLVMGGVLSLSVVDNFAYVDRSLPVAMPKAKGLAPKE